MTTSKAWGEGKLRIYSRCPSCGFDALAISERGHLFCTWLECKNPTAIDDAKAWAEEALRTRDERIRDLEENRETLVGKVGELSHDNTALRAEVLSLTEKLGIAEGKTCVSDKLAALVNEVAAWSNVTQRTHERAVALWNEWREAAAIRARGGKK